MIYIISSLTIVLADIALTTYIYKKRPDKKIIIYVTCFIYIAAVCYLTLMSRTPVEEPTVKLKVHHWWKLETSYLNILLFIPLGYLFPVTFSFLSKRTWLIPLTGLTVSYAIEYLQNVYSLGWFDVNDILCNFIGAYIGLFVFELIITRRG